MTSAPATFVYDGDCGICRTWVDYWRGLTGEKVAYRPYQEAAADLPAIPLEALERATHLIAADGEVGALYIVGAERLAAAGLSDAVKAARESVEYIVMHASSECDILELADALLPSSTYAEKEGTFTNYQGRVQKISRAIPAVGNSRPDFDILTGLLVEAGQADFASADVAKVFNLMAAEVEPFAGLTYEDIPGEGALIGAQAENG